MTTAASYLRRARRHLYAIGAGPRKEVLDDLRAHFADAAEMGLQIDEVIENLGAPEEVAARAREGFGHVLAHATEAWRWLVWASVTTAVISAATIAVLLPLFSGTPAGPMAAGADATASLLLLLVPIVIAAVPLLAPARARTLLTLLAAVGSTVAIALLWTTVGGLFVTSAMLLWAALLVWVRLRGEGFGPLWRLVGAVLAVAPGITLLATPWVAGLGTPRRYTDDVPPPLDLFQPTMWIVVTIVLVALCALLIAFGIRFAGWALAVIGALTMIAAVLWGGAWIVGVMALGGLWLTIGLTHAVATPPRD